MARFMTGHEELLGQLVEAIAQELEIPYKSAGQTTWKRPEIARGLESDESYFFRAEKLDGRGQIEGAKIDEDRRLPESRSGDRG